MREISEKEATDQFGAQRLRRLWETDGDPDLKTCDWRASVKTVLEKVDEQLEVAGLEVVLHDTGDDNYVWHIEQRRASES